MLYCFFIEHTKRSSIDVWCTSPPSLLFTRSRKLGSNVATRDPLRCTGTLTFFKKRTRIAKVMIFFFAFQAINMFLYFFYSLKSYVNKFRDTFLPNISSAWSSKSLHLEPFFPLKVRNSGTQSQPRYNVRTMLYGRCNDIVPALYGGWDCTFHSFEETTLIFELWSLNFDT